MNLKRYLAAAVVQMLLCVGAYAQSGAVTGHVTCADTNAPARLADVALMPVPEKLAPGEKPKAVQGMTIYTTGLDGGFAIPDAKPGRYYVVVHKAGYLAPDVQFTKAEIEQTDDASLAAIARVVPVVTVAAGQASNVDVRLIRGASISGMVRFDDGTPFDGKQIAIYRKLPTGKWEYMPRVDDLGFKTAAYSFVGLPAGNYRMDVMMTISRRVTNNLFGTDGTTAYMGGNGLHLYLGDTFRQKDAVVLTLHEGEAATGKDFTFPVAKLHSLAGAVVEERTGRAVNSGTITLLDQDDAWIAAVEINKDDATFRFPFVPEGTYRIEVSDAKELARELLPPTKEGFSSLVPKYKETTLRSFENSAAPLIVQTDTTGLLLPVKAIDSKAGK